MVFSNPDHLGFPACGLYLGLCRFGKSVCLDRQFLRDLAVCQHLQGVAALLEHADLHKSLHVYLGAVLKAVEAAHVYRDYLFGEDIVEATLRDTPLQGHLAALKAWAHTVAGPCLLALMALAGGLAVAGAVAAANALRVLCGAGHGCKLV